jgi:DNA polymerase (family 10)
LDVQASYLLSQNTLSQVQGIGAGLVKDIQTLIETGGLAVHDELLAALPHGLPELLKIKGLGVKKVRQLWQSLGVTSVEALEHAARTDALLHVEGFGKKTQDNILKGIALLKVYRTKRRYATAFALVQPILSTLSTTYPQIEVVGEMRLKMQTVSSIEILVATSEPLPEMLRLADGWEVAFSSPNLIDTTFPDGFPLKIHFTESAKFGLRLWELTGTEAHISAFKERFGAPADTLGNSADEADIYKAAGCDFVPPELRQDGSELELAHAHNLPVLIEVRDLKGSLHNHSTYSDGANTLREMAEACIEMGLEYFGICDHSQSLKIANGMPPQKVVWQQAEILELNVEFKEQGRNFRIFSGIESDILADGALDYTDDVLASFDLVVASIHQGTQMSEEAATNRLIRAIENRFTTILGHPTGRLLLAREGYPINHEQVIAACAQHGVAIELNANPYRLDIDWTWIRHAVVQGVFISINPDAHSTKGLHDVRWGVEVARKAGLTAAQCLNAMNAEQFQAWLKFKHG